MAGIKGNLSTRAKKEIETTADMRTSKPGQRLRLYSEYGVVILFMAAGISAYVIDSAVDAFIFHDGPFLEVLASTSPGTVSIRLYILASFVILGVFVSRLQVGRKRTEERLSAVNSYGGKLNAAKDVQQVYELTLDAMEKTLGFEFATFMVVKKNNLTVVCYRGLAEPTLTELPIDGTRGITVKAVRTQKPLLVPDVGKDESYVEGFSGIQSELVVPIVAEDRALGVLDVESRKLRGFSQDDLTLLQILASHAATAINNLLKREEIEKRSGQMASLMKSSAQMMRSTDLRQRLQTIAEAIRDCGWRRVVISVRDENMKMRSPDDMVSVGLTDEEREFLWEKRPPGKVVLERFGPEYERFKIGEFYYLPWSDPWLRERYGYQSSVPSHLKPEEMIDWDPQDTVYAPLRLADGRIVGRLSMDDPTDGRRPTKESLAPLELFLHQAAVAIENAQLIQQLNEARTRLQEYADHLEAKVRERTSELEEAQSRLLKSERLAAIGELAGMVGHDLRNPLTSVAGATYYLKTKCGREMNGKAKEMLEIIEKDIGYSNKIISDLLEYSREITLELSNSTPKALTSEALSLVEIPQNVELVDLTEDKPRIKVDVDKLKRAFVNITKNALEAMPKGGKLTIKSKKSNDHWEIAFSDTGTGITKSMLEKLWSPLFTTKPKGMGFGLPICKRIVEAHGGKVTVKSAVAKGTTFTISIPINPPKREGKVWVGLPESLLLKTTGVHVK
jgi:signal transduction histidine kinase/putative methionine-R-sulfoxide reductase with GAF domain